MRSDKKFDEMWDKVIDMAIENNIEPAQLSRKKTTKEIWKGRTSTPRNTD